jgi:hypothetical protein
MKYIYNKHIAPITANARDEKGVVLFTKKFLPERADATTGRIVSTGYTALTDEEYDRLCKGSRTFAHYKDELKLLVVSDDVPPEAKSPNEALVDARRETRAAKARITELEGEIEKLKARVFEAEDKYKKLASASLDEEKVKGYEDRIAGLAEALNQSVKAYDSLRGLSKVFAAAVGSSKKLEDAVKAANEFVSESAKADKARKQAGGKDAE